MYNGSLEKWLLRKDNLHSTASADQDPWNRCFSEVVHQIHHSYSQSFSLANMLPSLPCPLTFCSLVLWNWLYAPYSSLRARLTTTLPLLFERHHRELPASLLVPPPDESSEIKLKWNICYLSFDLSVMWWENSHIFKILKWPKKLGGGLGTGLVVYHVFICSEHVQ